MRGITPRGWTPIYGSLLSAKDDFIAGQDNNVVLVSDGIETCGGDPCAAAKQLRESGIALTIHVVGFDVDNATRTQLQCVANAASGRYYDAKNGQELANALNSAVNAVQLAAPAKVALLATATPTPTPLPLPTMTRTPVPVPTRTATRVVSRTPTTIQSIQTCRPVDNLSAMCNFDAVIVNYGHAKSSTLGARDCRTNELVDLFEYDLDVSNGWRPPQSRPIVGRTYHFDNALLFMADYSPKNPLRNRYLVFIESPNLRYSEISKCP